MKKLFAIALSAVLAVSMVACSSGAEEGQKEEVKDVVATASTYSNKYTNLSQEELLTEISRYSGVTVVATTNPDGTPNIAIFTPGAVNDHIVFNTAPCTTMDNLRREKTAEMIFDKVNVAAETKEGRHQGAAVKIALEEDEAVINELKSTEIGAAYINDNTVICKIVEVMPVG